MQQVSEAAAARPREPRGSQEHLSCGLSAQVCHPDITVLGSHGDAQGGWPVLGALRGAQRLSSVPTFACSLVGGGRGDECGAEVDVPAPALPQPLPLPVPAALPQHVAPALPAVQPPVPAELPAKPAPVYSDAVRGLPDQAPRSTSGLVSSSTCVPACVCGPNPLRWLHVWP